MERHFLDYIRGYVRIRITGNSYDRFLNLCAYHRLRLWNLLPCGEAYEACISLRDFRALRSIVKKSRVRLRITGRCGLPFFVHRYRRRKMYLVGIAAAACFMLWLSSHVWRITIEGNLARTDEVLFDYLEERGVYHGMRKSGIDCKALAADIRNEFSDFSWVAVELSGTWLQIHVREGIFSGEEEKSDPSGNTARTPSSLAASESGVIERIYVRKGLPMVRAGDSVEKGQVLVTGALPVYNDSGEVASYQYVEADADVVVRTVQEYREEIPAAVQQKVYTGQTKTRHVLRVGTVPFALPAARAAWEHCDVAGETVQFHLMEHFYLPLYFTEYTQREYEYQEKTRTAEELRTILERNLQYFMKNLGEKGVQIFENNVRIECTESLAVASGTLTVGKEAVSRVPAAVQQPDVQSEQ